MYCDLDDTYCGETLIDDSNLKSEFEAVCAINGGTALCNNIEEFKEMYSGEAQSCAADNDSCVAVSNQLKKDTRKMMIDYFSDIIMAKVKDDNATHSVYASNVSDGTLKGDKYIIAISPADGHPLGSRVHLSSLRWDSFQTRKLKEIFDHAEPVRVTVNKNAMGINRELYLTKRNDHNSQYRVSGVPILVTLIQKKAGENNQFSDKGKIRLALNTFDSVITFG